MRHASRLACAAAALTALAVAGPTAAGGPATNMTAKIRTAPNDKLKYSGRVTSDSDACVPGRRIKISAPGVRIGKPKTDSKGKFELIGKGLKSGTAVTFKLKATSTVCIGLESTTTAP